MPKIGISYCVIELLRHIVIQLGMATYMTFWLRKYKLLAPCGVPATFSKGKRWFVHDIVVFRNSVFQPGEPLVETDFRPIRHFGQGNISFWHHVVWKLRFPKENDGSCTVSWFSAIL